MVGYMPYLAPNSLYSTMKYLIEQYGPIFKLRLGSVDTVVITDYQLIKKRVEINAAALFNCCIFMILLVVKNVRDIFKKQNLNPLLFKTNKKVQKRQIHLLSPCVTRWYRLVPTSHSSIYGTLRHGLAMNPATS